jgi:3-oxoacyl-ACP reductase-like protein
MLESSAMCHGRETSIPGEAELEDHAANAYDSFTGVTNDGKVQTMSDGLELNGRRALVTGGTQGIGEAVVARLREAGVRVLTTVKRAFRGRAWRPRSELTSTRPLMPAN